MRLAQMFLKLAAESSSGVPPRAGSPPNWSPIGRGDTRSLDLSQMPPTAPRAASPIPESVTTGWPSSRAASDAVPDVSARGANWRRWAPAILTGLLGVGLGASTPYAVRRSSSLQPATAPDDQAQPTQQERAGIAGSLQGRVEPRPAATTPKQLNVPASPKDNSAELVGTTRERQASAAGQSDQAFWNWQQAAPQLLIGSGIGAAALLAYLAFNNRRNERDPLAG